jgi:hypothetical protein
MAVIRSQTTSNTKSEKSESLNSSNKPRTEVDEKPQRKPKPRIANVVAENWPETAAAMQQGYKE